MKEVRETAQQKFDRIRRTSTELAKEGKDNVVMFLSGSQNMKTRLEKLVRGFKEDADLDFEIGVIDEQQYKIENRAYEIMADSLKHMEVF